MEGLISGVRLLLHLFSHHHHIFRCKPLPLKFTPIYTMEVKSSSKRIEKLCKRLGTISLREFKATFSTVVCELEFKYGANYTKVFAFK